MKILSSLFFLRKKKNYYTHELYRDEPPPFPLLGAQFGFTVGVSCPRGALSRRGRAAVATEQQCAVRDGAGWVDPAGPRLLGASEGAGLRGVGVRASRQSLSGRMRCPPA